MAQSAGPSHRRGTRPRLLLALLSVLAVSPRLSDGSSLPTHDKQVPLMRVAEQEGGRRTEGKALVRVDWSDGTRPQEVTDVFEESELDVWRCTATYCDFVLPSTVPPSLLSLHPGWSSLNITTLVPSLPTLPPPSPRALALSALSPQSLRSPPSTAEIHDAFHPYSDIASILRSFAVAFPNAEIVSIGLTSEGRDILGLKVRSGQGKSLTGRKRRPRKEKEWIVVGGQHAREWISTSTVLYLAHSLLLAPPSAPLPATQEEDEVEELTYTLIPTLNPDGYDYTWTSDRLWRKNRQPNVDPSDPPSNETSSVRAGCLGVDLNRNWGFHFTAPAKGRRANICSDSFAGFSAFSARETAALSTYILAGPTENRRMLGFLDLHSYAQQILFPYAYDCGKQPDKAEDLWEAVYGAAKAVRLVHGRNYEVGGRCDVSYGASGDAIDWIYGAAGIDWAFASELRDLGTFGFLLPPSQIRPQGEEAVAMLKSLVEFVLAKEGGWR